MMTQKIRGAVLDLFLFAAGIFAAFWILDRFFFLLFPFVAAWFFSEGIRTCFRRLKPLSRGAKRILIILILLIFFSLISLIGILLADRALHSLSSLSGQISEYFDAALVFMGDAVRKSELFVAELFHLDPEEFSSGQVTDLLRELLRTALNHVPSLIGRTVSSIPKFFISLFLFVFATYYFSCDWERFSSFLGNTIPEGKLRKLLVAKRVLLKGTRQFGKAYFLLFVLTFSQLYFGFVLLGIEGAFLKATVIALVDILPVLGCGTVLLPWAVLALLTGNSRLFLGLLILYGVIAAIRQFSEPKILGDSMGLHPIISLILVIGGLTLFGFGGMIFLPIGAACFFETVRECRRLKEAEESFSEMA
ncbi:MAG: AI-2E family transporter [Clostridia bacterium]|nr:AI-2E family transporter [Clostridia bacterium]